MLPLNRKKAFAWITASAVALTGTGAFAQLGIRATSIGFSLFLRFALAALILLVMAPLERLRSLRTIPPVQWLRVGFVICSQFALFAFNIREDDAGLRLFAFQLPFTFHNSLFAAFQSEAVLQELFDAHRLRTNGRRKTRLSGRFIRSRVREMFGETVADSVRILYGGSVKPDNIAALMSEADIDGALVGGASLEIESFARIVNYKGNR